MNGITSEDDEDYADSVLCHVLLLPCGLGVILCGEQLAHHRPTMACESKR